jgi:predicted dehydrogenase
MNKVRWGIIGCGDVTEKKSGPAFNKVSNSSLVAVMRRDGEKVKDYAMRHNVPKWYTDVEQLINDEEVNAIYVATPPVFHEEYSVMALRAGKPVYVEKPMAMNAASAERMTNVSQQTNTKLCVAHYRREQPLFKKIKSLLDNKAIGTIRMVNLQYLQSDHPRNVENRASNWRLDPAISGGGLFHDLAPHQLDLMLYFFGPFLKADGISLNNPEQPVDDVITGHIHFANGVVFNGSWCFTVSSIDEKDLCEVIGSEGSIQFSVFKLQDVILNTSGTKEIFRFYQIPHVQQPMIESVVKFFLGEGPNPCPAEAGIDTMRLIDAFTKK